jgi:hypothetical protein
MAMANCATATHHPAPPGLDRSLGPCEPGRVILLGDFASTEGGSWELDLGAAIEHDHGIELTPDSRFAAAFVLTTPDGVPSVATASEQHLSAVSRRLVIRLAATDSSGRPVDHDFHWQATVRLEPQAG